ncbi:alpha-(1,3)-fucosyltransferase C [Bicyclus anynana]|uniref:Fucosyltransferase n=1 Tax=Bicyclus anynana TaxID=110368 RepID=A0A6J1ND06_BICAN|nr:alpha-(1,3)-fucosyltransferase C [Bicyclus anynana]XP_052742600.1 alpha-(1,3)-fucosyltransferase C [Bicyclus anynana]XP_052742601.1 alpha-(1,3)-fucosyltransferase C [Bicyclus anynana]
MRTRMYYIVTRLNVTRLIFIVILMYAASLVYTYNARLHSIRSQRKDISYTNHKSLKYILQWTNRFALPLNTMGEGNSVFVKGKCKYTNCYVTDDKEYFLDQTEFDAVVFGGLDAMNLWSFQLPYNRSPRQKYIFAASESADNNPVCSPMYNDFFNWTWTYRIDSDLYWGYVIIYDLDDNVVGPAVDMKWLDKMNPIVEELKSKLLSKSKTAAWFVSHCSTNGGRELYVKELQKELDVYKLNVDVYGGCGTLSCPRDDEAFCFKKLEDDYYFYLSFENSFAEDYVTEKLLNALNNYAIPIVYGTANYSRFLPPGSYLDALALGPKELAHQMNEILTNRSKYHDFFRWRNHYRYGPSHPVEEVCKLCTMLNNPDKVSQVTVWKDFDRWWNGKEYAHNCLTHWWSW